MPFSPPTFEKLQYMGEGVTFTPVLGLNYVLWYYNQVQY